MVDVGVAHRPGVERDRPHLRRPADDRHLGRAHLVGVAAGGELDPRGLDVVGRALRHALLEERVAAALLAGREHDPRVHALGPALERRRPVRERAHDAVLDRQVVVDDVELRDRGGALRGREDHAVAAGHAQIAAARFDDGRVRGHALKFYGTSGISLPTLRPPRPPASTWPPSVDGTGQRRRGEPIDSPRPAARDCVRPPTGPVPQPGAAVHRRRRRGALQLARLRADAAPGRRARGAGLRRLVRGLHPRRRRGGRGRGVQRPRGPGGRGDAARHPPHAARRRGRLGVDRGRRVRQVDPHARRQRGAHRGGRRRALRPARAEVVHARAAGRARPRARIADAALHPRGAPLRQGRPRLRGDARGPLRAGDRQRAAARRRRAHAHAARLRVRDRAGRARVRRPRPALRARQRHDERLPRAPRRARGRVPARARQRRVGPRPAAQRRRPALERLVRAGARARRRRPRRQRRGARRHRAPAAARQRARGARPRGLPGAAPACCSTRRSTTSARSARWPTSRSPRSPTGAR